MIDANDIIHHPEVMAEYCQIVGLKVSKMACGWDSYTAEEQTALPEEGKAFLPTIVASRSVMKAKAPTILILTWRRRSGEKNSEMMQAQ